MGLIVYDQTVVNAVYDGTLVSGDSLLVAPVSGSIPSATFNGAPVAGPWYVGCFWGLAVDAECTLVGGTAPTIQFFLDRMLADGVTVGRNLWASAIMSSPAAGANVIGSGLATPHSFGQYVRFRWLTTGAPTSALITVSLQALG